MNELKFDIAQVKFGIFHEKVFLNFSFAFLGAKTISAECDEPVLQEKVIHSATQCAFATSQLVACARVVAPTIESNACQEQLTNAAKQVAFE
ncbi:unnamed protein product [Strongylus vulgaris]|uniref:Talin R4 domain-containing protein n=1 Tax=Strongylus vulgaris TaxID=40348 RepID=A0A3P7LRR7_STRVU|nr:unnamed protein product [Strongylus vulgaris]